MKSKGIIQSITNKFFDRFNRAMVTLYQINSAKDIIEFRGVEKDTIPYKCEVSLSLMLSYENLPLYTNDHGGKADINYFRNANIKDIQINGESIFTTNVLERY